MIRLTFIAQREVMRFEVKNRSIYYTDRIWKDAIRLIPKDPEFIAKIRNSRNKYSKKLIDMFSLTPKQEEEYNSAKDDAQLAQIIIKDCLKQGITLHNQEELP